MTAPRLPREQPSVFQTGLSLLLGVVALALVAGATLLWPVVQHLLGWMWR